MHNNENKVFAHTSDTSPWQTLSEHSYGTAVLCSKYSIEPFCSFVNWLGLHHDAGKASERFQQHLCDPRIRTEHSLLGAHDAINLITNKFIALIAAHCIIGHHTGLPDTGVKGDHPEKSTLYARLARPLEPRILDDTQMNRSEPDIKPILELLAKNISTQNVAELVERVAFITRYCFSCLCDADTIDTVRFTNGGIPTESPSADFTQCLERINQTLSAFKQHTALQKARSLLQQQVYRFTQVPGNVFLLNMPTGSGKTLCSMKFALERALKHNKKRIIYISGYNAIIDQTAETFEALFGSSAQIVRHQSSFSYDDLPNTDETDRLRYISACENWDAPLIVTTTVQFFESIAGSSRKKLRKLHNLANCILILDEVHTLPLEYLQPCLKAIAYITTYLNSEAILMTATMPDYKRLLHTFGSPDLQITDLLPDKSLFGAFRKCRFQNAGLISDDVLLAQCKEAPSSLVIVNSKRTARELYNACSLPCKYHLSTYMTAADREKTISQIREALQTLEADYPGLENVPDERCVVCFSTSLIEAGVDLDFSRVFRELTALDSILQAGGRCNREGKRDDAEVLIFEREDHHRRTDTVERNITKHLLQEYQDISHETCIQAYFERLIYSKKDDVMSHAFSRISASPYNMNYRTYAEHFHLIEDRTVSVVVASDDKSAALIEALRQGESIPERKLQRYAASVSRWELEDLCKQGTADDFGTGIYCLTNRDYYKNDTGILFTGQDLFDW